MCQKYILGFSAINSFPQNLLWFHCRMKNLSKGAIYPFGLKGTQFLSTKNSIYIQSEILANKTVRVMECNIEEKWMKVKNGMNCI